MGYAGREVGADPTGASLLEVIDAVEFVKPMANGKTGPCLLTCEKNDGTAVEVVAKFSAGCERGVTSLAIEAVGACLAGDLGLPVPQPFIVTVSSEFVSSVPDTTQQKRMRDSSAIAFGSRHITGQYTVWTTGTIVSEIMRQYAAAILTFDGIIQNPDRRDINPNCLVKGDEIRIFDHELSFPAGPILGWRPPWVPGGLEVLTQPGFHIFRSGLKGREIDFQPIRASWSGLSDDRIHSYGNVIPNEWAAATNAVATALQLIKDARDNIDACIVEIERVLT